MTHREITGEISIAPRTQTAVLIGCDVVGAPAGLHGARELLTIVEREEQTARRVALAAVLHRFDEIGTSIPFGTAFDVRLVAFVRIEQNGPDTHEAALIERERQSISRRQRVQRLE